LVLWREAVDGEEEIVNITFSGFFLVTLWGPVHELSFDGFLKAISRQAKPFMFEKALYLSIKTIKCHYLIVVTMPEEHCIDIPATSILPR
jgi:hypothetical protein